LDRTYVQYIGLDSETVPFGPGDMAPELVCIQYQTLGDGQRYITTRRAGAVDQLRRWLLDPEVTLVLHNAAYDAAVWCAAGLTAAVFAAYRAGRIVCTWVFERLGEIAGYSSRKVLDLGTVCRAHGLPTPESWSDDNAHLAREFAQFLDAEDIPPGPHREYALDDTLVIGLFARQVRRFRDVPMHALQMFSRSMFWMQLMSVWGLLTSPDAVEAYRAEVAEELAFLREFGLEKGFIYQDRDGTYHRSFSAIRAAVTLAYDGKPPMTEPAKKRKSKKPFVPQPRMDEMTLLGSEDPALIAFARYGSLMKAESNDIPMLETGILHSRYGIADTGRSTSSKPALQNLSGKGKTRECIVAAPGMGFLERDYSGVELCSFAQVCVTELGDTSMADMINASGDPSWLHAELGGYLLGISAEELLARREAGDDLAENARTRAKNADFGFIGGLGAASYVNYVFLLSKGKIKLTLAEARGLKEAWGTVIPGSGITRRGMWYCAAANCRFQGLAAAVMHEAGWRLAEACYLAAPGSLWHGVRVVAFIHDAFILEVPVDKVHDVDVDFERILREAGAHVMPDVITKSEGHASYNLAKKMRGQKARRAYDAAGRLIPWTPT
jgi:hypothetical protein